MEHQSDIIVNRVAQSPLVTFRIEEYYAAGERKTFDIKPFLYMEWVLKEKDFRESLKQQDWTTYKDAHVAIHCS